MSLHGDSAAQPDSTWRSAAGRTGETGSRTVELTGQVAEAGQWIGARLRDPAVPHTVDEFAQITRGFATTAEGMADGLGGITEWLRAAGHGGALSGHAGVVGERLAHLSRELTRLAEAVDAAESGQDR